MSRKSLLSRRASGLVEPELPLRGYFLSVGGALLLLLLAADWVLTAPLPSRLIDSHSALPPIRIHSELKGPEAVVIDINGPMAVPADKEITAPPSQLSSFDVTDATQEPRSSAPYHGSQDSPATSTISHLRESLALSGPAVSDQVGPGRSEITSEPQRRFAHTRSGKRRRSAWQPGLDVSPRWRNSSSREHGPCRYAFMRTN